MRTDKPERWLPVPGTDGFYEVSDRGRVRSWRRPGPGGKRRTEPKILGQRFVRGYARICSDFPGSVLVHRLVLEAFVGPCPEGCETRHLDGDGANNRLENLTWGTHTENVADKARHGTAPHGERHWAHKLTADDVRLLRSRSANATTLQLASEFGITHSHVSAILGRRSWAHV